jgi:hypothetical protein
MEPKRQAPPPELPDASTYPEPYYYQPVVISEHLALGEPGIRIRQRVWKKQLGLEADGTTFYHWVEVTTPAERG